MPTDNTLFGLRAVRRSFSSMSACRPARVGNQPTVNVTLQEKDLVAQEVVVTGIFNKPKESYTGAAVTFTGDEIRSAGAGSLIQALANLDPTFAITEDIMSGSDPNNMPNVTMRGSRTLPISVNSMQDAMANIAEANLPLVILNDFPVPFQRLMDMDDNLIETVTLLKDASATAVYGTKSANGVVVVKTKLPAPGELRVQYVGRLDINVPDMSSYNLMNAAEKLEYERLAGLYHRNGAGLSTNRPLQELYNSRLLDVKRGVDTYWLKYPTRVGVGHRHTVSIEGGEPTFRYNANISYANNAGVMKESGRENFNGNLVFVYTVDNFRFQNDLQVANTVAKNSPYGSFATYSRMNPYLKPYDDKGNLVKLMDNNTYYGSFNVSGQSDARSVDVNNPLWNAKQPQRNENKDFAVTNNLLIEWNILPELMARATLGVSTGRSRGDVYKSSTMTEFESSDYEGENAKLKGSYKLDWGIRNMYEGRLSLNYSKTFNDVHVLYASVAGTLNQDSSEDYSVTAYGISNPNMDFYGAAKNFKDDARPWGSDPKQREASFAFSANYTYDRRYYVDLSGNFDGKSSSGVDERFSTIWAAGAGWNIDREHFFNVPWVNLGRIRANYGVTGSPVLDPYQANIMFNDMSTTYEIWGGSYIASLGNPNLKGSETYSWNVGTEWQLFNNRLSVDFNYYRALTKNLVTNVNLPSASGFPNFPSNIGETENKGFDVNIRGTIIQDFDRDFSWNVGVTAGHNKNKVKKISESLKKMNEDMRAIYGNSNATIAQRVAPAFQLQEGQSMSTIFVLNSLGIDPLHGKEVFLSADGKQQFQLTDWRAGTELIPCGNRDPDVRGTINTRVRWRGLILTAYFGYSWGSQDYNQTLVDNVETSEPWKNTDKRALTDRWNTVGQRAFFKGIREFTITSPTSRFVYDNNYFTLSSLNLSYEVPSEWSRRVLDIEYLKASADCGELFFLSSMKRERGINYLYDRSFSLSLTARF